MPLPNDALTTAATFTLPESLGAFDPDFRAYLHGLGQRRASVLLLFPPKAAGTYLRAAAIDAAGGQLTRIVHAFGGRDATPYLPNFLKYFAEPPTQPVMVSHVHMQAFPANRRFIEAFDLKPVIMLRSVPDMLCSFIDMLNTEPLSPELWLNAMIPQDFPSRDADAQADFVIDMVAPWYASYFATWFEFVREAPDRICVLRFADFKRDPAGVLQVLLGHSRIVRTREQCERALANSWRDRGRLRFNKGEDGRGAARLKPHHLARIETLLFDHYGLAGHRADLMPEAA